MSRKNLILLHRGPEYERDFDEIALRVNALDRNIVIYTAPVLLDVALPEDSWQFPTLTVAMQGKFKLPIRRGPVLSNFPMGKLEQQAAFRRAGVPTPATLPFQFGMVPDPILFGEHVVLKPADLDQTSDGAGVLLFRRSTIPRLKPADFAGRKGPSPADTPFLLQRFVHTGTRIFNERVTTLMGEVISSWRAESEEELMPADPAQIAEGTNVAVQSVNRRRFLTAEPDILEVARKAAAALPETPLLGIDVIREQRSGRPFVLECNAGGNTWFFASKIGTNVRQTIRLTRDGAPPVDEEEARRRLIGQFAAYDVAAAALKRAVDRLAS